MSISQVMDIQSQIKNLNADFEDEELRTLLNYNTEIKKYLLQHIKDDITLKHINEIPIYKLEDFKIRFDYIGLLVSVFSGRFDSFNNDKYDFGKAKVALNEINNKYASLEQMLRNQLS
jgi:hypothetical protein